MTEYPTGADVNDSNDRKRRLSYLEQMGKAYVEEVKRQIMADKSYQTEQQKETAIGLVRDGYAIDADEARQVFLSLPRVSSNDQYSRKKR